MGRHRAAGSLLSLLLGVFLLVQASLFANGAAETNGVLLDEYGVQYAVRATISEEMRQQDQKYAEMERRHSQELNGARAETEQRHSKDMSEVRAEVRSLHQLLLDREKEHSEEKAAIMQRLAELEAKTEQLTAELSQWKAKGGSAPTNTALKRMIDEQGDRIEEAMDGVESAASKVEALETEVKDVWHKFPPAFEDMRKKQSGLEGGVDVLNKSVTLLRIEHDRNFVSHEELHGAGKEMHSDLQRTMDKVDALEAAQGGAPGSIAVGVRAAALGGGIKSNNQGLPRNASRRRELLGEQEKEEEDSARRQLRPQGVSLSVEQGSTTLLNSGGLEVTDDFTVEGDATFEGNLVVEGDLTVKGNFYAAARYPLPTSEPTFSQSPTEAPTTLAPTTSAPTAVPTQSLNPDHEFDFRNCTESSSWVFPSSQSSYYFATATDFALPQNWTIETWVMATSLSCASSANYCLWLSFSVGDSVDESNCMHFYVSSFPATDVWYYMVITWDGSDLVMYRNGIATTDGINTGLGYSFCGTHTGCLVFGQDQDSLGGGFSPSQNAAIEQDTVAIYSEAWSASAIQSAKASVDASDPNLYALWTDTSGTDKTGNGNTATIISSSTSTVARVADAYNASIVATSYDGASCSADGMVFDGVDGYADVTSWQFGGAMTVEAYVKYNNLNKWSRIFDFSEGNQNDQVFLTNVEYDGTGMWGVYVGSSVTQMATNSPSFWETNTWVHVVATVDGTTMKLYKNGTLTDSMTGGQEPTSLTRTHHLIGWTTTSSNEYFDGTIAYLRFWHGEALGAGQVAELYADRSFVAQAPTLEPTLEPTTLEPTTLEPTPVPTGWGALVLTASSSSYAQMSRSGLDAVFGGNFTIEVAYKLVGLSDLRNSAIFSNYGPTSCSGNCIGINQASTDDSNKLRLWLSFTEASSGATVSAGGTTSFVPVVGTWYHLTLVYNNHDATFTFYVDGDVEHSESLSSPMDYSEGETMNNPSNDLYIGGNHLGRYHNSQIRAIRIWNVTRSATEVASDMLTPERMYENVQVLLPFHEVDSDNISPDISGNGHDATLYGGAAIATSP